MLAKNWIGFNQDTISIVFKQLDIEEREEVLEDRNTGETIKCECCNRPIKKEEIGAITKGSKHFYCKEPGCFAKYIVENIGD